METENENEIISSFFVTNSIVTECCVLQRKLFFSLADIQNVQLFRNGPVHEFYSSKGSPMSELRASSHEYPDVEKIKLDLKFFLALISFMYWCLSWEPDVAGTKIT